VQTFVRNRHPDRDTVTALATEVGADADKVAAWFVDRAASLAPEAARHLSALSTPDGAVPSGAMSSLGSAAGPRPVGSIRQLIEGVLVSLDAPRFITRAELWDGVAKAGACSNKQFGSSLQAAYTGATSVVVRKQDDEGKWLYGLRRWGMGGVSKERDRANEGQAGAAAATAGVVAKGGSAAAVTDDNGSGGARKFRMTEVHEALLNRHYDGGTTRPVKELVSELAATVGCKEGTIKVWFRKRRQADELREFVESRRRAEDPAQAAAAPPAAAAATPPPSTGEPTGVEAIPDQEQAVCAAFEAALRTSGKAAHVTRGELLAMLPAEVGHGSKEAGALLRAAMRRPGCPIVKVESADGKSWVYGLREWPIPGTDTAAPDKPEEVSKGVAAAAPPRGDASASASNPPPAEAKEAVAALTKVQQLSIDRKRKAPPQWNDKWSEETAVAKTNGLKKKVRVLEHTKAAMIRQLDATTAAK